MFHRIVACAIVLLAAATAMAEPRRPNIVFILMDDMGWRDVGFAGNKFVETPNIDALAKRGLIFTQSYSSAPNCAPTRACLMSGQFTPRHGIYTVVDPRQPPGSPWQKLQAAESKSELDTNVVTIAESLRDGGYATAFFGMWNLGRGRSGPVTPGGQGFQHVVLPENLGFAKDAYFDDDGHYLSDRLTDEVLTFIEQHRTRPFYLYYADHAVHAPFDPKPDLLKKYEAKNSRGTDERNNAAYAATIEAVDQNVGRIVAELDRLKLSDDTVVVFTSDNGGTQQFTAPLNGSKGELYEGGIRVPAVVAWPSLANLGSKFDAPITTVDWYPTLLELAGLTSSPDQTLDGISLVPAFRGAKELDRPRLFWHFPCYVGRAAPSSALREGDYKLIEFYENGDRQELYNLKTDPNELHDLAIAEPERAAMMYQTLLAWQKETGAAVPEGPNSKYDPKADRPSGGQGGKGSRGGGSPNGAKPKKSEG